MASPPDPIDPILNRWQHADSVLPEADALSHEVWRRIADAEGDSADSSWRGRIAAAFIQPSFGFAFVAACTLFGLFLAEIRVSHRQAQHNVMVAKAYLHLIDPLLDKSVALVDTKTNSLP